MMIKIVSPNGISVEDLRRGKPNLGLTHFFAAGFEFAAEGGAVLVHATCSLKSPRSSTVW